MNSNVNNPEMKTKETNKFYLGDKVRWRHAIGVFEVIGIKNHYTKGTCRTSYHIQRDSENSLALWAQENDLKLSEDKGSLQSQYNPGDKTQDPQSPVIFQSKENIEYDNVQDENYPEASLYELLKDCDKNEVFYSPIYGQTLIKDVFNDGVVIIPKNEDINHYTEFVSYYKSRYGDGGEFMLYPSRALYEKYPLEPIKAWQEWTESRKPKRWRAEKDREYWYFDAMCCVAPTIDSYNSADDVLYKSGNYFCTESDAREVVTEIKALLEDWHKRKEGKQ